MLNETLRRNMLWLCFMANNIPDFCMMASLDNDIDVLLQVKGRQDEAGQLLYM